MICLSFVDLRVRQRVSKQSCGHKSSRDDKILSSLNAKTCRAWVQGSKWAISIRLVSIESTLLLFLLNGTSLHILIKNVTISHSGLVTFTEDILDEKLHFLCNAVFVVAYWKT